jgi:glycosyltransferase involved in cell wall biosynthesis
MRLAVAFLSGGGLSGGASKTLRSLVPRLREHSAIALLELFLPFPALKQPDLAGLDARGFHAGRLGSGDLPRRLRNLRPDVVFVPNAAHPGRCDAPVVVMVRNVEPIVAPVGRNRFGAALRNLARAHRARRACRRADRIIAVSGYVRRLLTTRWDLPAERIGMVPHGVDPAPPGPKHRRPTSLPEGVEGKSWLAVGSLVAYRGLEDAVAALADRVRQDCDEHLLVAGGDVYGLGYRRYLADLAERLGLVGRVHFLGQLPREELAFCYARTLGLLMTSRLEACPNVALEALSAGCEVIATDLPPMPEFFADAAMYYPPGGIDMLVKRMQTIRSLPLAAREQRSKHRRKRAEGFSWQRCCERTVEELDLARS